MLNILKGFDAQAASNHINPYAVDVIRAKRKDLVYGISHTEDLLDLLVTEGVMTAAKRSIVLSIRTRKEQNSRVLEILEARGERACRKFFHPCLMLAEPDLYQGIRAYVGSVSEHIRDTRRQLIGYLLEKEKEGMAGKVTMTKKKKTRGLLASEKSKRFSPEIEDSSPVPLEKLGDKAAPDKPENLVHMIATDGDLVLLEELLKDTDINSVNSSNETLLHVAAKHGHLSISELLIRKGARLDLQDNHGHTALHSAASRGHNEIVRALVKAGAPIYSLDLHDKTPLHLAAENEHVDVVTVLVKEEARQTESHTQDMFLHMAAIQDNWRLAELLLQRGAAVEARNNHGKTPLFYAVARSNEETVTVLLNAGAEVDDNVINEAIEHNQESVIHLLLSNARGALSEEVLGLALFSAVRQNQHGTVTALIDSGADVNMCDTQGYTPLLLAAELGHPEVFRVLLAKQAKIDAALCDCSSALHLAVHSGSVPIVQTLLEKGLDPNITGPQDQHPLHLAALSDRSDLVGLLIKAGSQVNAVNQDGLTALHLAGQQGHADTVIQLLQNKADPAVRDKLGRTALHWAASSPAECRVVDLMLSATANTSTTDNKKETALHLAAMERRLNAVVSLLHHKANGGAKDMDGSTPLHYAAAGGHTGVVSALLQSLSNKGIEERNAWRRTPLHAAAEKGHDSVAVLLLEAGAKINATDHSKDTPLHCAVRGGHQEVVKRLVNWGQAAHSRGWKKVNLQAQNKVRRTPLQVAESGDTPEHESIATLLKRKMFLIK
ncbi:CARD- and ANK-domain containing inflammasome adapter protein [Hippoglossus stenolepis]|uniref:CARD- and ANK-domain containing inflammasome adapter protein n=1 Tax=Hippoglossus stenolepis TaxID=195615 RepID=UPI00159CC0BF|nr:CARD- and ANK-domain containing inflammasome adapter protein [Hippoglossus stenolepis]